MIRDELLSRLADLPSEKPSTKMGQVRWAWPHLQAALAAGHTLRTIHARLSEVGIDIGYRTLSLYIGRLERQGTESRVNRRTTPLRVRKNGCDDPMSDVLVNRTTENSGTDPFSNVRLDRQRKRKASFEYDAFSTNKDLLG